MENITLMIASIIGAGGLTTIVVSLINKKKTDAEAHNVKIESLLKIDERINTRMAKLEERVEQLELELRKREVEILKLTSENMELKLRLKEVV